MISEFRGLWLSSSGVVESSGGASASAEHRFSGRKLGPGTFRFLELEARLHRSVGKVTEDHIEADALSELEFDLSRILRRNSQGQFQSIENSANSVFVCKTVADGVGINSHANVVCSSATLYNRRSSG